MRIVIIEDEYKTAKDLAAIIALLEPTADHIGIVDSIEAGIEFFKSSPPPDLIFSDIQLGDGTCFDLFQSVRIQCPVIFCTAYDQYAIEAFKHFGVDYILKPFNEAVIRRSLEHVWKLKSHFNASDNATLFKQIVNSLNPPVNRSFLVTHRDKIIPIKASDIAFFWVEGDNTSLFTLDNKKYILNQALDKLEQQLTPDFFRANRQYLINRKAIVEAVHYFSRKLMIKVSFEPPQPIVISREKSSAFLKWLEGCQ